MAKENRVEMWLHRALEMEKRGHELYIDAAQKASDKAVIDFFKMLADQELIHLKIVQEISDKLAQKAPLWPTVSKETADLSGLNALFHRVTGQKLKPGVGIVAAIEKGMNFEVETRDYYKMEIDLADDEAEKNFLKRLVGEENSHYQMLADMKLFYTDPEAWSETQDNMHLDGV